MNRAQGKAKVQWTGGKPQASVIARGESKLEIPINRTVLVTPVSCRPAKVARCLASSRHPPAVVSKWSFSQITVPGWCQGGDRVVEGCHI